MKDNTGAVRQQFSIDPTMKIRDVSLNVSNLPRSIEFYQSILGFRILGRPSNDRALLSQDGNHSHLVELLQIENGKSDANEAIKRAGLYHFAILLPERKHLADMLLHLGEKRDSVHFDGLADHLVSESIYIRDPDLNGIEVYHDRPYSEWKWNGTQLQMATLPLNTDDLLKASIGEGWKPLPAKTMIGHVHLHVRDLAKAVKFYHDTLGLGLTTTFPGASFFAAGRYHHHIATNTWLGNDLAPASQGSIGLNHFSIELSSKEEFQRTVGQLSRHGTATNELSSDSVLVQDTDGIEIRVQYK